MTAYTPTLAKVRTLLEQRRPDHSLPQAFYTDPEIYEFDLLAIYGRSWIMAGFEVELPGPGCHLAFNVGRTPVLIVRGRDGMLRGFFNTCRHRGAQICEPGTGRSPRIVCPYHQWSYDLTGKLAHAGRMGEGFDPSDYALRPIHVETVAGTIYVCLADDPPDFAPFRASLEPLLALHDLTHAKLAAQSTLVEQANWKLVMENARECYHCAARHPELRATFPVTRRALTDDEQAEITDSFRARMAQRDLGIGPADGPWWQAARFPLNEGTVSMTMDGQPVVKTPLGRVGDGDVGSLRWALDPHLFAHALGDYVIMFSAMPTGLQETVVTCKWLVSADAEEGRDYTVDGLTELWNRTNLQDRWLAENNQRGVNSLGYVPGPYSEQAEVYTRRFVDWYCAKAAESVAASEGLHATRAA